MDLNINLTNVDEKQIYALVNFVKHVKLSALKETLISDDEVNHAVAALIKLQESIESNGFMPRALKVANHD
ncbi:hypothetical protein [Acinetobacter lactucae]|uniref:hypothetical protein n=1 Tax=Acinetobacter lactucae TaxID=1785128 RepID=UPI0007071CDF|nr:hypothetical protein [Acinetobacter lactucae]KQE94990.1 hypothetical protein APB94_04890 [Acinetobacter lactucae]